jgi:hypothetical protein
MVCSENLNLMVNYISKQNLTQLNQTHIHNFENDEMRNHESRSERLRIIGVTKLPYKIKINVGARLFGLNHIMEQNG